MTARWCGVIVIAVIALFESTRLEWSGGLVVPRQLMSRPGAARVIPAGTAERFLPWASDGPDPRWGGCWLADVTAKADTLHLEIRCPEGGTVTADLLDA